MFWSPGAGGGGGGCGGGGDKLYSINFDAMENRQSLTMSRPIKELLRGKKKLMS